LCAKPDATWPRAHAVVVTCVAAVCAFLLPPAAAQGADLIVTNAKVATLDEKSTAAEALAVRDGRIIGLGSGTAMRALSGPGTRVIDAGGRTVIPGLIDSHMHAVRAALSYSAEVNWIDARKTPSGWRIAEERLESPLWVVIPKAE
jgi:predicted amidohydrolase YtcJ